VHKESEKVENYLSLRNNSFEVVGAIATEFGGEIMKGMEPMSGVEPLTY
jgi:hypothetical protein